MSSSDEDDDTEQLIENKSEPTNDTSLAEDNDQITSQSTENIMSNHGKKNESELS